LLSDLSTVAQGITRAVAGPDWVAIRNHSHVLISLAGTLGAAALQIEAEALNLLARQDDESRMPPHIAVVGALLSSVIDEVGAVRKRHHAMAQARVP
jgi:HPt (histidine-containing phosphotransfer) domain-containing protein